MPIFGIFEYLARTTLMTTHLRAVLLAITCAFWSISATACADEPAPVEDGLFITVPNPISGEAAARVKETVERALSGGRIRKIVFDFNPSGQPASTNQFGPCLDLAKYLERQHQISTIAFVRARTSRHTVLPVLACKEVVMASEASLGDVLPDQAEPPDEDELRVYARLAGRGREALVLKMLDKNIVLLEGRTRAGGVWFLDGRKKDEAEREGIVAINPLPLMPAGSLALYSANEARKYNLCQQIRDTRQEIAELYQLPASSLREDPLQGRSPVAYKMVIRGEVNRALDERIRRQIGYCIRKGANTIVLQLECSGGDFEVAGDLAEYLRTLRGRDELPIVTVAFVPTAAPDTATFLALGCTEIVLGKGAVLGSFAHLLKPPPLPGPQRRGRPVPPAPKLDLVRDALVKLAQEQGYSPVLIRGLFDADLEIYRVRSKAGTVERRFMSKADFDADTDKWIKEGQVKPAGQLLELTAAQAKDYGVARYVVDNSNEIKEVYALYGFENVADPPPDWLQSLADFLGDPIVAMFLVIIGVTCLILELKMPGVGIPGVIAALCFVLFFWSQSQMNGQITLLAILLFLLGLVLIGIEIFLIPGFGVTGVSGVVLVLCGLGLATVEHLPQTRSEWMSFGSTITTFGFGLVIAGAAAFALARYLPNIPYANRLVLTPPGEKPEEGAADLHASHHPELLALLGAVGTAATMLRPAGMARFGDAYVDVVTEGGYVSAGTRVQVIEIEGNRIVVKEV
jgi:membrane-bound serine protease (ClpP class)